MYREKVEIEQLKNILVLGNTKKVFFILGFVSSYKQGGLADHNSRSSLLMLSYKVHGSFSVSYMEPEIRVWGFNCNLESRAQFYLKIKVWSRKKRERERV